MPVYKETADDFNKKYHSTFVLYDGKLAFVHHFQEMTPNLGEQIGCQIKYDSRDGSVISAVDSTKLEPFIVDNMFINVGDLKGKIAIPLALVQRKPKRQWKRGLCQENTQVKCPVQSLYTAFGKNVSQWDGTIDWNLVKSLHDPVYPSLTQACKLCEKFIGIAISPMFAITLSNISNSRWLLCSPFGFIGECDPTTIWIHHKPAFQEVFDFVKRTNQPISVELVNA